VVLLGDDFIQAFSGSVTQKQQQVVNYFNHTFTRNGGGDVNGVALGIAGDLVSVACNPYIPLFLCCLCFLHIVLYCIVL
jgi:predicted SnoaL-like aldol condensation-catalyzing enzyme